MLALCLCVSAPFLSNVCFQRERVNHGSAFCLESHNSPGRFQHLLQAKANGNILGFAFGRIGSPSLAKGLEPLLYPPPALLNPPLPTQTTLSHA
jgi:hypothetical protein